MQRRWLAVFVLVLAAVVGFVVWTSRTSESETAVVQRDDSPERTSTESAASAPAAVAGPSSAEAAPAKVEMAAPVAEAEPLVDPRELASQGAIEFSLDVTWPANVPADEQAFLVVEGKGPSDVISRMPLTGGGKQTLYLPKDRKKGRVVLDARYLYLEEHPKLDPGKPTRPLACAPQVGAWLTGRVVFPEGADPEECDPATLRVTRTSSRLDRSAGIDDVDSDFSKLGADGRYSLGGLAPTMQHWVSLDAPGLVTESRSFESVAAGKRYEHDFSPSLGVRFLGRVVDAAGQPIADARVECVADQGWGRTSHGHHVDTAADGTFGLRGVQPRKLFLHVSSRGFVEYTSEELDCADGDVHRDLHVVLERGNELAGVVRWADGAPADGATIRITDLGATDEVQRFGPMENAPDAKCDAEGKFTVSGLGRGPFDVVANATQVVRTEGKKRERKPWRATSASVEPNRRDLVLVLAPPLAVVGTVTNDLGAPVTKFTLRARLVDTQADFQLTNQDGVSQLVRDDSGAFRMEKLHVGSWRISVEAPGHETSEEQVVRVGDGDVVVNFVCPRATSLSGVVLDPDGVPVAGASIHVQRSTESRTWSSSNCATDTAGKFSCEGQYSGQVNVWATHSAWADSDAEELDLEPGAGLAGMTLHLRRGGRVEVTVLTPKDAANSTTRVTLVPQSGLGRFQSEETDPTGVAVFEHVAPGDYDARSSRMEQGGASGGGSHDSVTVVEGRTSTLVLGRTDTLAIQVSGVVRSGSRPLGGVQVSFWQQENGKLQGHRWCRTGADGRYELTLDAPGTWHAYFGRESASKRAELDIPAQASFAYDVAFGAATVSGRVLDLAGAPVAGVNVALVGAERTEDSTFGEHGRTDDEGRWKYEYVTPGRYTVTTNDARSVAPGCADVSSAPFDLVDEQELTGIDLVLIAGGKLEVRLRGAARDDRRYVQVLGPEADSLAFAVAEPGTDIVVLDGVAPGRGQVVASSESARAAPVDVEIVAGATRVVELELVPDAKLVVRIVDGNGAAVAGFVRPGDPRAFAPRPNEEPQSEHTFEHLMPGKQQFGATTPSGATGVVDVELVSGETKTVEIVVGT